MCVYNANYKGKVYDPESPPADSPAYSVNSRSDENFIRNTSLFGPCLEYVFRNTCGIRPEYCEYGQNTAPWEVFWNTGNTYSHSRRLQHQMQRWMSYPPMENATTMSLSTFSHMLSTQQLLSTSGGERWGAVHAVRECLAARFPPCGARVWPGGEWQVDGALPAEGRACASQYVVHSGLCGRFGCKLSSHNAYSHTRPLRKQESGGTVGFLKVS
jgi:hypothetical protein